MPSVSALDKEMQDWAQKDAAQRGGVNYYQLLLENRESYYRDAHEVIKERNQTNFEDILGDMHALLNGILPKSFGDPILQWLLKAKVFENTTICPDSSETNRPHFNAVHDQLKTLFQQLARHVRRLSQEFERGSISSVPFSRYKALFSGLGEEFEFGIYNLNYDTVAITGLPDLFTGFSEDSGNFVPSEVNRKQWGFVYHLHGSVHHCFEAGDNIQYSTNFGDKIVWKADLSQVDEFKDSGELRTSTDQRRMVPTTLIAGRWKLDQIQEEPFQSFYSSLPYHAYEADAILICGYGFGDGHINSVLSNMLHFRGRRPPVLVLGYDELRRPLALMREPWAQKLQLALRVSREVFRNEANRSKIWSELPDVIDDQFEKADVPVAVWSGGVDNANTRLTEMLRWFAENKIS